VCPETLNLWAERLIYNKCSQCPPWDSIRALDTSHHGPTHPLKDTWNIQAGFYGLRRRQRHPDIRFGEIYPRPCCQGCKCQHETTGGRSRCFAHDYLEGTARKFALLLPLQRVQFIMPSDFPVRKRFSRFLLKEMPSSSMFHQWSLQMRHVSIENISSMLKINTSGERRILKV
jgi:hypothetical protein